MNKTRLNESILKGLSRPMTHKAVLLHSGGVDSTAAGIMLMEQGYEVFPLFIDYGQRALEAEHFAAMSLGRELGFRELMVMNQRGVADFPSMLTSLTGTVLDDNHAWVPGRNTLFLVLAGIYAAHIDADGICLGYCLDDNFVFGDNDLVHHQLIEVLLTRSIERPVKMLMPLSAMMKGELISLLRRYNVFDKTVSCWNAVLNVANIEVCGPCANCVERELAVAEVDSL